MCEGIELALALEHLKGEELVLNPDDPRVYVPAVSLALHKAKQRGRPFMEFLEDSKYEVAAEVAFADALGAVHDGRPGAPYDVRLAANEVIVCLFDVKLLSAPSTTVTQQASEGTALETGTWKLNGKPIEEDLSMLLYVVLRRESLTTCRIMGFFDPREHIWAPSVKYNGGSRFANLAAINWLI